MPNHFWKYAGNTTAALWAAVVSFFSLQPREELPVLFFSLTDGMLHVGAYAVLAFALGLGRARHKVWSWRRLAVAFFLGSVLEVLQPRIAGRDFDGLDLLSNALGIFLGTILASLFAKRIFNP